MKKVKIMLGTFAAIAAIGGASALKVKKNASITLYTLRPGDFVPKPNPTDAQNCIETIATDGIFTSAGAHVSYYYITSGTPVNGINPCYYRYYLTKE